MARPSSDELFAKLRAIIFSGAHPVVIAEKFTLTGSLNAEGEPTAVLSFVGVDLNEDTGAMAAAHVIVNPEQAAKLESELVAFRKATEHYQRTGEQTVKLAGGALLHRPIESNDDRN